MDRIEAVEFLENCVEDNNYSDYHKALRMAIKALKQPEIVHCGECVNQYKPTCPFGVWINTPDDGHCHWAERRTDG